jgi:hypothetical protein
MSKFHICGLFLALPIFLSVGPSGISLPENFYEMAGIPLHLNIIALLLMMPNVRFTKKFYCAAFVFTIYLLVSVFQSFDRVILAIQSIYFLLCCYFFNCLSNQQLKELCHGAVYALYLFCFAHLGSMLINSGGSPLGLFSEGSKFWGLHIYQSFLTYPLVIIFGLFLFEREFPNKTTIFLFFMLLVVLIEIILMRRVGLSLFILFVFLYKRKMFLAASLGACFASVVAYIVGYGIDFSSIIEGVHLVLNRMVSGEFTRAMTWERSLGYLSEINTLLLGNGRNNHSHNWFMHTLTTHGILYSIILFSLVGYRLTKFIVDVNFAARPTLFILGLVLVDWNFNVNLYQPYYAGMLALVLAMPKSFQPSSSQRRIYAKEDAA